MSEELVTVAYEFSPLQANLMRTRLEAEGIECFISGETLASVVGSASYASASWDHPQSNIELQVPLSQADQARELLRELESSPLDDDKEWPRETPSHAVNLLRVCISAGLSFYMTFLVAGQSQNLWLGGLAGAVTFSALCFLSLKKSFKSKY